MFINNDYERPFRSFAGMRWPQEKPSAEELLKAVAKSFNKTPFSANLRDAEGVIVVEAHLPGVPKSAVTVNVLGRSIKIHVARSGSEKTDYLVREVGAIEGGREFHLQDDLDAASARAELKDGVLTLRVSKKQRDRGTHIEIA